ncbi:MAG: NAD(P)H-hydrate dehydratase [Thermonemataceae bacterium]
MKILLATQIRELDQYTITHEPIASIDLMERASNAFVTCFIEEIQIDTKRLIKVFCGTGNNGGDGLAIARLLSNQGYEVEVFVVRYTDKTSKDFDVNYERLARIAQINDVRQDTDIPSIEEEDCVIDALFGTGLSREITGIAKEVVQQINESKAMVVAVDIASGLQADQATLSPIVVKPNSTVSFQMPKLAHLQPNNALFTGKLYLVEIGLHTSFLEKATTTYFYTTIEDIKRIYQPRKQHTHKGTFGHALLIGGSYGKVGAVILNAQACLRVGVGLLTVHVPQCAYTILQSTVIEAMVHVDRHEKVFSEIPSVNGYKTIGVGSGLGTHEKSLEALEALLTVYRSPLVIDADALNLLARHPYLMDKVPPYSILTPHPKEFERLVQTSSDDWERFHLLRAFCKSYQVIVVLKGHHTAIAHPEGQIYFNTTGNAGMATAGSGDVLTGMLTGLLAQGYAPLEASRLGVYLHGLAGDIAAHSYGEEALIASDIIQNVGSAYKRIQSF